MKKTKRILATLFVAGMALTMVPAQALAACPTTTTCAPGTACVTPNACAVNSSGCPSGTNNVSGCQVNYSSCNNNAPAVNALNLKSTSLVDLLRNCLLTGKCN